MELDELIPQTVSWKPKYTDGDGKELEFDFTFRPFTLEDESWIKRNFPGDELVKALNGYDKDAVTRIAYKQLNITSKKELMAVKFIDIDEHGKEVEYAKTGPDKIGLLIVGVPEQLKLLEMLMLTRGMSMPMAEEVGKKMLAESKAQ